MMSRDRAAALALLLFGLAGACEARRLTIGDPGHPGPGFFPFWLSVALCLVAVAIVFKENAASPPAAISTERLHRGKAVLALAAGAAYAAVLQPLGFVVTTFLFLLFLQRAIEPRRWGSSLAISAATSIASHLLFKVWLDVQLPGGPWGF